MDRILVASIEETQCGTVNTPRATRAHHSGSRHAIPPQDPTAVLLQQLQAGENSCGSSTRTIFWAPRLQTCLQCLVGPTRTGVFARATSHTCSTRRKPRITRDRYRTSV